MDLQQYYEAIKRRWQYMLASVIIIMLIVGVNIALSPPVPVFRAESRIFVATGTTSVGPEDVAAMATSNIVASQCIDELKLGMRPFDLLERVRAEVGG